MSILKKIAHLNVSLNNRDGLEVTGLKHSPNAENLRQWIRENRNKIIHELKVLNNIGTPAREFLDLVHRGEVIIHIDGRGGFWWTSPKYDDPGSLSWIAQIWSEAVQDMFLLLDAGRMDNLIKRG